MSAFALASCGGGEPDPDIGVPVPSDARDAAVEIVRTGLRNQADAEGVPGPSAVQCEAVAHVEGRPRGQQYDQQCVATFPNGRTAQCRVPAGSNGQMGCTPALVSEAPFPGIYERKTG